MRNSNKKFNRKIIIRIVMILLLLLFSVIVIYTWKNIFPNNSPYRKDYEVDYYDYNNLTTNPYLTGLFCHYTMT